MVSELDGPAPPCPPACRVAPQSAWDSLPVLTPLRSPEQELGHTGPSLVLHSTVVTRDRRPSPVPV